MATLVKSLDSDDFEDYCVITEFSINEFIWTGKCKLSVANNVFTALGIDLDYFGKLSEIDIGASLKLEVKEEVTDNDTIMQDNLDFLEDIPLKELQQPRVKRKYTKRQKSE